MTKPKLTYFDIAGSRGEECRLALHIAGVDFEDVRIKSAEWGAMKDKTPYGALPVLELPGKPPLADSNSILRMIGLQHGLHPSDPVEAARHEAMMQYVEDMRAKVGPTIFLPDDQKKAAREPMAKEFLPAWGRTAERNITGEPFFGGAKLQVVDLKIYMAVRWFISGGVDFIPGSVFDGSPKLVRIHNAVRDHPGVKSWYAKKAS